VLVTFSIQLMSIFIFLFVLVTLKATLKRKLILTNVYILAVVLTWFYTGKLPHLKNMGKINFLITFVPVLAVLLTLLTFRLRLQRQAR
jgi:hypothetical protein